MCGITGFSSLHRSIEDRESVLEEMTAALTPRGPDGSGVFFEPEIALGHRRLSIIDIEGGAQPMSTPDGRFTLVYNGEIYNYMELRSELEATGSRFTTKSDTEVLLCLLARYGIECLEKINGMFAFGLWDAKEKRLFLARDRIGIKPLVYARTGRDIVFASEIKSILKHPALTKSVDTSSLSKFLTYGYIPAPHSIYKDVSKLEPATYAVFDANGLQLHRYWDIPLLDNPVSDRTTDECAADLRALLRDSVKKRLRSDVPVGVFLSGGIDSSAITAFASESFAGKLQTFSMGFDEPSYDETPYSKLVSEVFGTDHHHETVTMKQGLALVPESIGIMDEPFADASIVPTYMLSRMTSREVKVVLGGDGGDELFAGYASFGAHKIMEALSFLPRPWRDALVRSAKRLPISSAYTSPSFLTRQFFKGAGVSPEIRFFLWMGAFGTEAKHSLLSEDLKGELLREDTFSDLRRLISRSGLTNDFERLLYLCMKLYLQDDILVKVDRASMAHSLETRVPFLDHNIVEYVSRLDGSLKMRGFAGSKYIFKKAMKGILPERIIKRRKAGFALPVASWLQKDLSPMLMELCSDASLRRDGWFDTKSVQALVEDHISGRKDYRKEAWALMCLMLWRDKNL